MALQPSIRVINGKVFGAYAAQAKNVAYGQGTVEDALDELTANIIDSTYVSLDYETEYVVPNDGYVRGFANGGTAKYVDLQVKLNTGEWITITRGGGTQSISDVEVLFVKKGMHIKVIGSASTDVICRYYPIITE